MLQEGAEATIWTVKLTLPDQPTIYASANRVEAQSPALMMHAWCRAKCTTAGTTPKGRDTLTYLKITQQI